MGGKGKLRRFERMNTRCRAPTAHTHTSAAQCKPSTVTCFPLHACISHMNVSASCTSWAAGCRSGRVLLRPTGTHTLQWYCKLSHSLTLHTVTPYTRQCVAHKYKGDDKSTRMRACMHYGGEMHGSQSAAIEQLRTRHAAAATTACKR